jgi:hypothetical protein
MVFESVIIGHIAHRADFGYAKVVKVEAAGGTGNVRVTLEDSNGHRRGHIVEDSDLARMERKAQDINTRQSFPCGPSGPWRCTTDDVTGGQP